MSSQYPSPQQIAELESDWVGRTVRVADGVPSLARFAGRDGQVRAVNLNGRCLVTFSKSPDAGWYDVAPADLVLKPSKAKAPAAE